VHRDEVFYIPLAMEALKIISRAILGRRGGGKFKTVLEQLHSDCEDKLQDRKRHFAASMWFNSIVALLILVNSVLMAVEVDNWRGDRFEDRSVFFALDALFLVAFSAEMIARLHQLGWDYFEDPWNIFDYALIVVNCVDFVVSVNKGGADGLKLASTLRALRLLRGVRAIRGLKIFNGLWLVIQGFLDSLKTMFWVAVLLIVVIYCLGVGLTILAGQDEYVKEYWPESQQYVGTPWRSMWTVIQIITLDNWAIDVGRPLNEYSPGSMVFVLLAIVLCTLGLLNLVVAVMVVRLQSRVDEEAARADQLLEETEAELLASLDEDFAEASLTEKKELTKKAFDELIRMPNMVVKLNLLGIKTGEAENLFNLIDADKSGTISPTEFTGGIQKLRGEAKGEDLVALICFMQRQRCRAQRFVERVQNLSRKADEIQGRLNGVGRGITDELVSRKEAEIRNEEVWGQAGQRQCVIDQLDRGRQVAFPSLKANEVRYGITY